MRSISVEPEQAGWRLDRLLTQAWPQVTRSRVQKLLEGAGEQVSVDGRPGRAGQRLRAGQTVLLPDQAPLEPVPSARLEPYSLDLDVLWEDADLLVINKPAGLVVHPAPGHSADTLVNALVARGQPLAGAGEEDAPAQAMRPGIVHRLDKDTSGLMVVAKSSRGHQAVARQLAERTLSRVYLVVVRGRIEEPRGVILASIARDRRNRQKMAVVPDGQGRAAETSFVVRQRLDRATVLEASLRSGRTHQVRVHFAHIGHPVLGDPVYGGSGKLAARVGLQRQALHSWRLRFEHPSDGRVLEFTAPPPPDLLHALALLGLPRESLDLLSPATSVLGSAN